MAIANVIRLNIFGTLPGGEVWSVNPVWQIGGVSTAEDITQLEAQTMANACAAVAIPVGLGSLMSSATAFTGYRVEARRWDGTLGTQAEALRGSPQLGSGGQGNPFQTSAVLSLRTAGIGASGRGRLYWPATGVVISASTLRPSAAIVLAALNGSKTYLTSLGTALGASLTNAPVLSVWSRIHASTQPVNAMNMGDVLDVQRRRRDQLVESYQSVLWP